MEHTVYGSKYTDLILSIFRFHGQLVSEGDRLTKDVGLTGARWHILGALIYFGEQEMTVSRIAAKMGMTRQGVQRIANELEKEGVIVFAENPHHKRSKLIYATQEGRRQFSAVMEKQIPWANAQGENCTIEELETALKVVRVLSAKLP